MAPAKKPRGGRIQGKKPKGGTDKPAQDKSYPDKPVKGSVMVTCPTCGGSGRRGNSACGLCGGSGKVRAHA